MKNKIILMLILCVIICLPSCSDNIGEKSEDDSQSVSADKSAETVTNPLGTLSYSENMFFYSLFDSYQPEFHYSKGQQEAKDFIDELNNCDYIESRSDKSDKLRYIFRIGEKHFGCSADFSHLWIYENVPETDKSAAIFGEASAEYEIIGFDTSVFEKLYYADDKQSVGS